MRGIRNDNPVCGTDAGVRAHGKGNPRCDACKAFVTARKAEHRKQAYLNRGSTLVEGIGTRRRIQALAVMGYGIVEVAELVGCDRSNVAGLGKHGKKVTVTNAATIAAVYERLSGTPGPNKRAMLGARGRGWAGPLDWDEGQIDNPQAVPHCQIEADHADALAEEERRRKVEIRKARMQWLMEHQPGEYERQRKAKQESSRITKANKRARERQARAA